MQLSSHLYTLSSGVEVNVAADIRECGNTFLAPVCSAAAALQWRNYPTQPGNHFSPLSSFMSNLTWKALGACQARCKSMLVNFGAILGSCHFFTHFSRNLSLLDQ